MALFVTYDPFSSGGGVGSESYSYSMSVGALPNELREHLRVVSVIVPASRLQGAQRTRLAPQDARRLAPRAPVRRASNCSLSLVTCTLTFFCAAHTKVRVQYSNDASE